MKRILVLLILFLLCANLASAKTYHITLLTIGEVGEDSVGGTADAYLEVKHGSGRIFLDSFPLTKIDTQISTRYANEIACDYLDLDCSDYDFFYTIRAGSTIVGGPSASASLAILTIAALKSLELRNDTVMTGTINSGGSIGPVGGIVKKAMAAEMAGFKRVLIPLFTIEIAGISINSTLNLSNQSIKVNISKMPLNKSNEENLSLETANLSIEVVKVGNIDEALGYFTSLAVKPANGEIVVPDDYTKTMRSIANNLCNRSFDLRNRVVLANEEDINKSRAHLDNINKSFISGDYYSAASYCFNLGLLLRKANLKEIEQESPGQLRRLYQAASQAVKEFDNNLESINITTLPELESYIIVKERLLESDEYLAKLQNNFSADDLAYAIERYFSAVYWSEFFKVKGEQMELDKEYLSAACYKKLSEAEERINYAALYIPFALGDAQNDIKQAYVFAVKENYKMCLFEASFAKAESNLLLSTISIGTDQVEELANEKLRAARKVIIKEESRGFFPIMGYSYYQYANSLKEHGEPVLSLIFAEYSLELSNIEIYFPKKGFKLPYINYYLLVFGAAVFLFGVAIGIIISRRAAREIAAEKNRVRKKK
jgi:predicted S18 family serine protease